MTEQQYTVVTKGKDVTDEIRYAAEGIFVGWFADEPSIDWTDFLDRLNGMELEDGTRLDLGDDTQSPAIFVIKAHINRYRRL